MRPSLQPTRRNCKPPSPPAAGETLHSLSGSWSIIAMAAGSTQHLNESLVDARGRSAATARPPKTLSFASRYVRHALF